MTGVGKHIEKIEHLMSAKGFCGAFLSNSNFPGKLKDSLKRHMEDVLTKSSDVKPFYLTTYSLWNGEGLPYVVVDFKLAYDANKGFNILQLDAKHVLDRACDPRKRIEVHLKNNESMPTLDEVNAMVVPARRKRLKI